MVSDRPPVAWLPLTGALLSGFLPYDRRWLSADLLAGVTAGAVVIPQAMGYARFWLNLQSRYDLAVHGQAIEETLAEITPLATE